ncbi:hypothetical protein WL94_36630 [Burkholderia cepacia]|nr:hypothetical protein VL00_16280 [Burkholderia cepacia]KMN50152.1 hypothetical protein VK92_36730 [Burkholderia sp. LK4]KWB18512.1 hypothetical protein WL32_22785 [Burkholderia cepacia]KWH00506.1 hypothetical protein WL94_36630 [Burkholderia cepacia]
MVGRCDGILVSSCVRADIAEMSPQFNRITETTLWSESDAGLATGMRIAEFGSLLDQAEPQAGR